MNDRAQVYACLKPELKESQMALLQSVGESYFGGRCSLNRGTFFAGLLVALCCMVMQSIPAAPHRLAEETWHAEQQHETPPLIVPLADANVVVAAGRVPGVENGLTLRKGASQHTVTIKLAVDAARYNVLRLRMRVDGGEIFRMNWVSDIEPDYARNPGLIVPVFTDNEFHDYTFRLDQQDSTWAGQIQELRVFPAYKLPINAEITRFEFAFEPAPGPRRVSLVTADYRGGSIEAFSENPAPWRVAVPENGRFEAFVGMPPRSYETYDSDGVKFYVVASDVSGKETTIAERVIAPETVMTDRGWQWITADLSGYANQEVTLSFCTDHLASPDGDYIFWGAPMVFPDRVDADAVPVILVSLDTVRADHMTMYGYGRDTTPLLADWARREAVTFDHAVTQDAWTLPAHGTMLTGLYPKQHRLSPERSLPESVETLAEALRGRGYQTGGFTGVIWWLDSRYGFAQGFDEYETPRPYRHGFEVNKAAGGWLDARAANRLFLFVHNYDAHSKASIKGYTLPYQSELPEYAVFSKEFNPAPTFAREGVATPAASELLLAAMKGAITFTEEERAYIVALYDDSLRCVDAAVSAFFEDLKRRDLYDSALIIVTGDHGEAFGEHGNYMHEDAYEGCARVPLMVKFPWGRFAGERFAPTVEHADIVPTVCEVTGATLPGMVEGQSLLAVLEGRAEARPWAYTRRHTKDGVYHAGQKMLCDAEAGTCELFALDTDPGEANNLMGGQLEQEPVLREELARFYAVMPSGWRLTLQAGAQPAVFKLNAVTDDRIVELHAQSGVKAGVAKPEISEDGRTLDVTITLAAGEWVECLLQTAKAGARIDLHASADVAFASNLLPAETPPAGELRKVLDPETPLQVPADTFVKPADTPTLTVSFARPEVEGSAAEAMNPDELKNLEALGYLQ